MLRLFMQCALLRGSHLLPNSQKPVLRHIFKNAHLCLSAPESKRLSGTVKPLVGTQKRRVLACKYRRCACARLQGTMERWAPTGTSLL